MKTLLTILTCLFVLPGIAQSNSVNDTLRKSEFKMNCYSTLNNKDPLFVVDGILSLYSDIENLNPDDIVSLEVIKNPHVLKCYGSAAEYGVVLISTNASEPPVILEKDLPFKVYKFYSTNWNTRQDVYNAIQAKVPQITISLNKGLGDDPKICMRRDDTNVIIDGVCSDISMLKILNPSDIEDIMLSSSPCAQSYFLTY